MRRFGDLSNEIHGNVWRKPKITRKENVTEFPVINKMEDRSKNNPKLDEILHELEDLEMESIKSSNTSLEHDYSKGNAERKFKAKHYGKAENKNTDR